MRYKACHVCSGLGIKQIQACENGLGDSYTKEVLCDRCGGTSVIPTDLSKAVAVIIQTGDKYGHPIRRKDATN